MQSQIVSWFLNSDLLLTSDLFTDCAPFCFGRCATGFLLFGECVTGVVKKASMVQRAYVTQHGLRCTNHFCLYKRFARFYQGWTHPRYCSHWQLLEGPVTHVRIKWHGGKFVSFLCVIFNFGELWGGGVTATTNSKKHVPVVHLSRWWPRPRIRTCATRPWTKRSTNQSFVSRIVKTEKSLQKWRQVLWEGHSHAGCC